MEFWIFKSKSAPAFQNLVKKKAREFEFTRLLKLKNTKAKSKMKDIHYAELRMQKYLERKEIGLSLGWEWPPLVRTLEGENR